MQWFLEPAAHLPSPHRSQHQSPHGICLCKLGEQLIWPVYIWELDVVQQVADHVAIQVAEDHGSVCGRGGVLLSIGGRSGCPVSPRNLLERMGFAQECPTSVFEDNTACIEWGNNVICGRERAKHIDIRKHFAHEVIQNGKMLLIRVLTASQLADVFTKALY